MNSYTGDHTARHTCAINRILLGWLFWAFKRPFETLFQYIFGFLPERGRKRREMIAGGGFGRAMVLGNFQCRGVLLIWMGWSGV